MHQNKEGILGQILRIDNSIKIRQCSFTRFQQTDNSQKLNLAQYAAGDIEDYKQMKESLNNISTNICYKKLAFQPVRVSSRHR